ncbi:MAG TPA: DUF6607 family protein [Rhizomicrobium sp.]
MTIELTRRASAGLLFAALATPAAARAPGATPPAPVHGADFARDRQAILAMAGDFKVRFDMRETVSFLPDYTLLEPKVSGGHESVRVVVDTGDVIYLQHLLVAEVDGKPLVIKHWRQDWTYQPRQVLAYAGLNTWKLTPVAPEARAKAWAQTVWQTDDSPRYGGVGRWAHDFGVSRWTSDTTLRPLARRDAVRHPPYDHYAGTNRHALTPTGWVHEQDNAKLGLRDGKPVTYAHEVVLNSYTRDTAYPIAAADSYWTATSAYWAAVRGMWDDAIARGHGVKVVEVADVGSETGPHLMQLADRIATNELSNAAAIADAQAFIRKTAV